MAHRYPWASSAADPLLDNRSPQEHRGWRRRATSSTIFRRSSRAIPPSTWRGLGWRRHGRFGQTLGNPNPADSLYGGDRQNPDSRKFETDRSPFVSIPMRNRRLLGREQRDHAATLVGDHHLFVNARTGKPVRCRPISLRREHHAFLDLGRMLERNHPRDDRALVQGQSEPMAELQAEGRHPRPESRTPPPSATPLRPRRSSRRGESAR